MPKIITQRENGTRRVQFKCEGKSRTEQSHRERVNINTIMRKAHATGFIPSGNKLANYGDFTNVTDFQDAQNRIADAYADFLALPSAVRNKFDNDPGKLITFISDENNLQQAIEMGILPKPPKPPKIEQPATGPTSPPEAPNPPSV